jgi:hypothetical protein
MEVGNECEWDKNCMVFQGLTKPLPALYSLRVASPGLYTESEMTLDHDLILTQNHPISAKMSQNCQVVNFMFRESN